MPQGNSQNFLTGLTLYAFQAGQSIVRTPPADLAGLRGFYRSRLKPADLARVVIRYQQSSFARGRTARRPFFMRSAGVSRERDLSLMARLLFDFSTVLNGYQPEADDLACLRYCFTVISMDFEKKLGLHKAKQMYRFGRLLQSKLSSPERLGDRIIRWGQLDWIRMKVEGLSTFIAVAKFGVFRHISPD